MKKDPKLTFAKPEYKEQYEADKKALKTMKFAYEVTLESDPKEAEKLRRKYIDMKEQHHISWVRVYSDDSSECVIHKV